MEEIKMKHILLATTLVLALLNTSFLNADDVHYNVSVGMNGLVRMHDGNTFPIWGFKEGGGMSMMSRYSVPGPTFRAKEGDHVFLHFWNTSMLPHTIHPHGLDARQDVDGVPQTSFEIPMMGSFTYDFIAPHAGTYAYHCHVHTVLHLQMGMYGAVVIDSPDGEKTVWEKGPAYDIERIWDTGEFDSYWHRTAGGYGMGHGMWPGGGHGMWSNNSSGGNRRGGGHHGGDDGWNPDDGNDMGTGNGDDWWPGDDNGCCPDDGNGWWPGDGENSGFPYHDYNPDYFIVNGRSGTDIRNDLNSRVSMDVDQTLLLRLVNIGGYLPHRFLFDGLPATAVSSDGRPLPVQEMVEELTVYPGERYDVIVEPEASGNYQVEIEYLSIYDESVQGTAAVPISVRN